MPLTPQDAVELMSDAEGGDGDLGSVPDLDTESSIIPQTPPRPKADPHPGSIQAAGQVSRPGSISGNLPDRPLSIAELALLDAKKFRPPSQDDPENPNNKSVGLDDIDIGPTRPNDPFLAIQKNEPEDHVPPPMKIPAPAATGSSLKDEAEFFDLVIDDSSEKFGRPKYKPGSPDRPIPSAGLPSRPAAGDSVAKAPASGKAPPPVVKPLNSPARPAGSTRPMDPGATAFPMSKTGSPPSRPGSSPKPLKGGPDSLGGTHFPPLGPMPNRSGNQVKSTTGLPTLSNDLTSDLPPIPVMPPPVPPHLDPSNFMKGGSGQTTGPATSGTGLPPLSRTTPMVNPNLKKLNLSETALPSTLKPPGAPKSILEEARASAVGTPGTLGISAAPAVAKSGSPAQGPSPDTKSGLASPLPVTRASSGNSGIMPSLPHTSSSTTNAKSDLLGGTAFPFGSKPASASPVALPVISLPGRLGSPDIKSRAPAAGETAFPPLQNTPDPVATPSTPTDSSATSAGITRLRSMPVRSGAVMFPHLANRPSAPGVSGVRPKDLEPLGPMPSSTPIAPPSSSTGLPLSSIAAAAASVSTAPEHQMDPAIKVPMPSNPIPDHMLPYEPQPQFNPPPFVDDRPVWRRMELMVPLAVVCVVGLGIWVSYNFQLNVKITYVGHKPASYDSHLVQPTTLPSTSQPSATQSSAPVSGSDSVAVQASPSPVSKSPSFSLRSLVPPPPASDSNSTTQPAPSTKP